MLILRRIRIVISIETKENNIALPRSSYFNYPVFLVSLRHTEFTFRSAWIAGVVVVAAVVIVVLVAKLNKFDPGVHRARW